jgi:hypothetical protein
MNTPTTPPTPDTPDHTALPQSPDTRADDSLADDVFVDDDGTMALPTTATPATTAGATMTATAPAPAPAIPTPTAAPEPQYLSGPAPFALVLGLLGLLVGGSVLLNELTDVTLPWGDLGPWTVVAAGLVVLIVGAIGLRSSRASG